MHALFSDSLQLLLKITTNFLLKNSLRWNRQTHFVSIEISLPYFVDLFFKTTKQSFLMRILKLIINVDNKKLDVSYRWSCFLNLQLFRSYNYAFWIKTMSNHSWNILKYQYQVIFSITMKAAWRMNESFRKQSLHFLRLNACFYTTAWQTALAMNPVAEVREK